MEVYNIVQVVVIKTIPKKNMQEGKVVAWGGYTNGWGRKKSERQGKKGKIYSTESRVPENSKERLKKKKAFLNEQHKEIEENNRMQKTRDLFKKI